MTKWLVDGWQNCWKWFSQWFFVAIAMWETLLLSLETSPEVKGAMVEFMAAYLHVTPNAVTVLLAVLGMLSRMVRQRRLEPQAPSNAPPQQS